MSKLVTGDGRTHTTSSLMRESLVDKRVVAKTQSDREYEIMPDVALVSIGGQSIFDRGKAGLLPLVGGPGPLRPRAPHGRDRAARRSDGGVQRGLPERAHGEARLDRDAARALLGAAALPRERDAPDRDLDSAVPL